MVGLFDATYLKYTAVHRCRATRRAALALRACRLAPWPTWLASSPVSPRRTLFFYFRLQRWLAAVIFSLVTLV